MIIVKTRSQIKTNIKRLCFINLFNSHNDSRCVLLFILVYNKANEGTLKLNKFLTSIYIDSVYDAFM